MKKIVPIIEGPAINPEDSLLRAHLQFTQKKEKKSKKKEGTASGKLLKNYAKTIKKKKKVWNADEIIKGNIHGFVMVNLYVIFRTLYW